MAQAMARSSGLRPTASMIPPTLSAPVASSTSTARLR